MSESIISGSSDTRFELRIENSRKQQLNFRPSCKFFLVLILGLTWSQGIPCRRASNLSHHNLEFRQFRRDSKVRGKKRLTIDIEIVVVEVHRVIKWGEHS